MKKILLLLLLTLVQLASSQTFKGGGLKAFYYPSGKGWEYTDYLNQFYKGEPEISSWGFDVYAEFLPTKVLSTVASASYIVKAYRFEYDRKNEFGEITGTRKITYGNYAFGLAAVEKARYDISRTFSAFVFAGPRLEFIFDENVYDEFYDVVTNFNSTLFGVTAGAGIDIIPAKTLKINLEFSFNQDISKSYTSPNGDIRFQMIGVKAGFGFIPKR